MKTLGYFEFRAERRKRERREAEEAAEKRRLTEEEAARQETDRARDERLKAQLSHKKTVSEDFGIPETDID